MNWISQLPISHSSFLSCLLFSLQQLKDHLEEYELRYTFSLVLLQRSLVQIKYKLMLCLVTEKNQVTTGKKTIWTFRMLRKERQTLHGAPKYQCIIIYHCLVQHSYSCNTLNQIRVHFLKLLAFEKMARRGKKKNPLVING